MPITAVQQGILTELLFIILTVLGSDGALEVARQATDDDRRDADVHRRGDFILNLGFQIKSAIALPRHGASEWLHFASTCWKAVSSAIRNSTNSSPNLAPWPCRLET